jgi:hypothetical protein
MEHKLKMVNRQKYFGKPYKRIGKEHYSELVESKRKYNLYPTRQAVDLRDKRSVKFRLLASPCLAISSTSVRMLQIENAQT